MAKPVVASTEPTSSAPELQGEAVKECPQGVSILQHVAAGSLLGLGFATRGGPADTGLAKQYRQQHLVGQYQHQYAEGGGEDQVLAHPNVDDYQHREAHCVGQQGHGSGEEQERKASRAAVSLSAPRPMSCIMPFIFCALWDRPMAKIRKGTSIE